MFWGVVIPSGNHVDLCPPNIPDNVQYLEIQKVFSKNRVLPGRLKIKTQTNNAPVTLCQSAECDVSVELYRRDISTCPSLSVPVEDFGFDVSGRIELSPSFQDKAKVALIVAIVVFLIRLRI